ncbi:MAG: hypothetical protein R3250_15145, partial [Melioribacteraceae bacterium]|nr:hypothetical protein [Melioribacteraceae bacterium]
WSFEGQSNTLFIYSRNLVVPGLKWKYEDIKHNFAKVKASMGSNITISFMNRLDQVKTLKTDFNVNFDTSIVTKNLPPSQYLNTFKVKTSKGDNFAIPVTWQTGNENKEIEICKIDPGETVTLEIARVLESKANFINSKAISEDITMHFYLSDSIQ